MSHVQQDTMIVVSYEEAKAIDYKPPRGCSFFVDAAIGVCFFKTRDRKKAQEICDAELGEKKYRVSALSQQKQGGEVTCRASINSASRKGNSFLKMKSNYGAGE